MWTNDFARVIVLLGTTFVSCSTTRQERLNVRGGTHVDGTSGYFEFLRVFLAPQPDEADEQRRMKRRSGGRFDPEKFDLAKTDKTVRNALRCTRNQ